MSENDFESRAAEASPRVSVQYFDSPVNELELRGYGMFFGNVLSVETSKRSRSTTTLVRFSR